MKGTANARGLAPVLASAPESGEDPGRQFVVALARGLALLKLFSDPEKSLGNQELAELSGLTKPTVSRLTYTLTRLGYLNCSPVSGRYTLGTAALALGYWVMSSAYVRQMAKPLMQEVSREYNVCCALGYRDGLDAVYLEHTRGATPLFAGMQPGSRTPLATTAVGRCLIGMMDGRDRESYFEDAARFYGDLWPTYRSAIERATCDLDRTGFLVSIGDWETDISAVSVPMDLGVSQPAMSLVIGGASYSLAQDRLMESLGPRLLELAANIRAKLDAGRPH